MTNLRFRLLSLGPFRRAQRRTYEKQAAPQFLFERRSLVHSCVERRAGRLAMEAVERPIQILVAGNQPPYGLRRRETRVVPYSAAPALTITSDPYNSIAVAGSNGGDWALSFCAHGEGESEGEAQERLQRTAMSIAGGTVALTGPGLYGGHQSTAHLVVDGPSSAGIVIHAPYAFVEVRDMAGPVRVAATHARARVLHTTGQLDVTAGAVDFAGSSGSVNLSAESEINLQITTQHFEGTLTAWAQRSVRLLVPKEFTTPFTACVSGRADFVCRTGFASSVKHKRQGELHIFTYGMDNGAEPLIHLRSEAAAVVIDSIEPNN